MPRWRAIAMAAVCCLACAFHASIGAPLGSSGQWDLVFSEDFDDARLKTSSWTTCYWWNDRGCTNLGNNELEWYLPENVVVKDGALHLVAIPRNVIGIRAKRFPFTSGMVTTGRYYGESPRADRFSFTYGHVEVRAKMPRGQGLWPAIWMLPSTLKSRPEVDIMEALGHAPDTLQLHFHYQDGEQAKSVGRAVRTGDLSRDWHVFGLEWRPDALIWRLDGNQVWRFTDKALIPSEPMYLLINLAVGGDWPGPPDDSTVFPADFRVDYVRIWTRGP